MSNIILGNIYKQVMDRVLEDCQTTFEEDGVNHQTLDDIRITWQSKLSEQRVGTFPWDPPPIPQPMPPSTTLPKMEAAALLGAESSAAGLASMPSSSTNDGNGSVNIKSEPVERPQMPAFPPNYVHNEARERAISNLQDKFGANANAQITQLQQQVAMNQPGAQQQRFSSQISQASAQTTTSTQMPTSPPTSSTTATETQTQTQTQSQPQANTSSPETMISPQTQSIENSGPSQDSGPEFSSEAQARPVPALESNGASTLNTDGPADWDSFVAARRDLASQDDQYPLNGLKSRLRQDQALSHEGGLMMPLSQRKSISNYHEGVKDSIIHTTISSQPSRYPQAQLQQLDGTEDSLDNGKSGVKDELFGDDDLDDVDADAINSDLDDPDDAEIEDEEEEDKPTQVMLCTYDKVQRVKNKWKCTLRDGVLNSDGKEYVFGKASGEFEW